MSAAITIEELIREALTFPEKERAHLAQTLLQSPEPAEEGIEAAWAVEIGRRLEQVREGTAKGRPMDEVLRDIRTRYRP